MNAIYQANYVDTAPELRPMSWLDVDAVMNIETRIYPFPWTRKNFEDSLTGDYLCWVCLVQGAVVGYFVLMRGVDEAHLLTIGVTSEQQGRGLGASLLTRAIDITRVANLSTLILEVRPTNSAALRLYRHFGFRQIGIRRGYYPAPQGREDGLVLSLAVQKK